MHEFPLTIILDRDVKFVGHFWHTLWRNLGTNLSFSSAYHPQTDGKTKFVNRTLRNLLRWLTREHGEKWDTILPQAEFSYNDTINRSTGKSPFQIVYGLNPRGVLELRNMPSNSPISADGKPFLKKSKKFMNMLD